MYKGTLDENGNIEIREVSGGITGFVFKALTAAALGAVSYAGQYAAAKIIESAAIRKQKKSQQKKEA